MKKTTKLALMLSSAVFATANTKRDDSENFADGDHQGTLKPLTPITKIPYGQPPSTAEVNFSFEQRPILRKDLLPGSQRLRDTDNALIVPVHKYIRMTFTSNDVIHSFSLPGLEYKIDCIPGRSFSTHMFFPRTGIYYGACAELCGAQHSRMPFVIRAVHESDMYE